MPFNFKAVLAGAVFGIALTTVVFTLDAHSTDREETFGLLARDLHVAKDVAKISLPARIAASRSVAQDLRIVFVRYESLRQDEARLLQLTREMADAGIVVLPKDILTELRAKAKAGSLTAPAEFGPPACILPLHVLRGQAEAAEP